MFGNMKGLAGLNMQDIAKAGELITEAAGAIATIKGLAQTMSVQLDDISDRLDRIEANQERDFIILTEINKRSMNMLSIPESIVPEVSSRTIDELTADPYNVYPSNETSDDDD